MNKTKFTPPKDRTVAHALLETNTPRIRRPEPPPGAYDGDCPGRCLLHKTGGTFVSRHRRQVKRNITCSEKKKQVSMLTDPDILEYFRQKVARRGYQTLINRILRGSMERESLLECGIRG